MSLNETFFFLKIEECHDTSCNYTLVRCSFVIGFGTNKQSLSDPVLKSVM